MIDRIKGAWHRLFTSRLVEQLVGDNATLLKHLHEEKRDRERDYMAFREREQRTYAIHTEREGAMRSEHLRELQTIDAERLNTDYEVMCRISDLKTALDKMEKERDYFRARADRIELELLGRRTTATTGQPRRVFTTKPIGRTRWQQLQYEAELANAEADRLEKLAKAAEPKPDAEGQAAPQPDAEAPTEAAS